MAEDSYSVRQLSLLEGETVREKFVSDGGLVSDSPHKGQLLVLTNQRLISFTNTDGHRETFLAPLEELKGISVKTHTRGFKDIVQGLFFVMLGVMAYLVLGYVLEGVAIALSLGFALVFVGVLFFSRHLFWEEEGSITFQGSSWEFSFPYRTNRASADVYTLINRFFQLKRAKNTHEPLDQPVDSSNGADSWTPDETATESDTFYQI